MTATLAGKQGRGFFNLLLAPLVTSGALLMAGTAAGQIQARPLQTVHARATGHATFVTGVGGPIALRPAPGKTQVEPLDFFRQHGAMFGVTNADRQLVATRSLADAIGQTHTTYNQVHQGVRVFGGVLKVHQNAAGEVLAANGDFFPITPKLKTAPSITARQAAASALRALAPELPEGASPTVEKSELVIVDPGWYGDPPVGAHLAYYLILTDLDHVVREAFFVDAHRGELLDRWTLIHTALDRVIRHDYLCDDNTNTCVGGPNDGLPCGSDAQCREIVRVEGDPTTGDVEVDQAYDYTGDTYDFFARGFGRDGMDDAGGTMFATVYLKRRCPNAFGGAGGTFYCEGLATDDVVGHEWGHSIMDFTADLIYQNQPGQLNESYSDVWGELIDLYNGNAIFPGAPGGTPWPTHDSGPGTDTPNDMRGNGCNESLRWLIGEDSALNTIRDMWNPPCFGDPDRANSPLQLCSPGDSGGVHSGSGIPNHAFAMLTDGKTFNGYTINAIGPFKAAAVWYRAMTVYLTTISDFQDTYFSLVQSAHDLVGTTPNDPRDGTPTASAFTLADAAEVQKALLAVEMDTPGLCGFGGRVMFTDSAAPCADRTTIFSDDFESGVGSWTVSNTAPPTPYDWGLTTTVLPFGRPGVAFFVEDRNIGDCAGQDESAVHTLQSPSIVLPASADFPMLSFGHYLRSEGNFDGGRLSIQVNGGGWQAVPRSAIIDNPYNGALAALAQGSNNPLGGADAWTGAGGIWGTTIVDLTSFAGPNDTIDLRFEFGKDGCSGLVGWYVDDVEIFNCPDCDGNNQADVKEARYSFASTALQPIGSGSPQSFVIVSPPPAGSQVSMIFTGVGDFDTLNEFENEFVRVELNGLSIGSIWTDERVRSCTPTPEIAEIIVDAATFNAAVGGGNATIDMIASSNVNPSQCNGSSFISVAVSYQATGIGPDPDDMLKNRYLTVDVGGPVGRDMAIRVTLKDLPPPFDCHNGEVRWVFSPQDITEIPGQNDNAPPTFRGAELANFPASFDANGGGVMHLYGRAVVPNATYECQAFDVRCGVIAATSTAPIITVRTVEKWGDVSGTFQDGEWTEPNNDVNLILDCVSILQKFSALPGAPIKSRADIDPDPPNRIIDIVDAIRCIEGFQSFPYPFGGPQPPCP